MKPRCAPEETTKCIPCTEDQCQQVPSTQCSDKISYKPEQKCSTNIEKVWKLVPGQDQDCTTVLEDKCEVVYKPVEVEECKDTLREECGPVSQTVPVIRNEHVCKDVEEETFNTICEDGPNGPNGPNGANGPNPNGRGFPENDIDSYGAPIAPVSTPTRGSDIDSYGAPTAPLARALPEPQQICRQVPVKILVQKCHYEQRE